MARSRMLALMLLVLFGAASCDTDPPVGTGPQVLRVMPFTASASYSNQGVACLKDVWDVYDDRDNDHQADPDECTGTACSEELWCGPPYTTGAYTTAVPWAYVVEIVVIRAGEVVRTVLTPPGASTGSILSLTPGETDPVPPHPPILAAPWPNPPPAGTLYVNVRAVPESSWTWYRWCSGLLDAPHPNLAGGHSPQNPGLCDGAASPTPFDVEVHNGDTVIVSAGFDVQLFPQYADPQFQGVMLLDGRQVTPSGIASGIGPNAHLSFSYTVR